MAVAVMIMKMKESTNNTAKYNPIHKNICFYCFILYYINLYTVVVFVVGGGDGAAVAAWHYQNKIKNFKKKFFSNK